MNDISRKLISVVVVIVSLASLGTFRLAYGEDASAGDSKNLYAPYECLIGEWDVRSEDDGQVVAVQRGRWGPNRSYIWYTVSLMAEGREEPHFEGLLVWNGMRQNLDMLLVVDLKSGRVQEQGTISVAPDGVLIRDITAVYSAGAGPMGVAAKDAKGSTAHFRQTYKKIGPDKIMTSVLRETEHGWVSSFPGSDHLVMTRRSG